MTTDGLSRDVLTCVTESQENVCFIGVEKDKVYCYLVSSVSTYKSLDNIAFNDNTNVSFVLDVSVRYLSLSL